MQVNRSLEQHIAVFGESGSGKTVLLSSFYGASEETDFARHNHFNIVAVDPGQGGRLFQNYLGMKNSAKAPERTRFSTSYGFDVRMLKGDSPKVKKKAPFDSLRLVWHDYPGEWLEQDVTGEEAKRRVETFRALLGSDVALLLVDGQRLLDNEGQEEAYLRSLFHNYRTGIEALKDEVLDDGKTLAIFPRIWVLALSKSDLLPQMSARIFKQLIIEKAAGELDKLRQVLVGMVQAPEAMAVGEDFLVLSSARFRPGHIEVDKRVGVDLILPVAAMLPFERHARWLQAKQLPPKVAANLLDGADALAGVLAGVLVLAKNKLPAPFAIIAALLSFALSKEVVDHAVDMARAKIDEVKAEALAKQEYLTAVLATFRTDLQDAERDGVLLQSLK